MKINTLRLFTLLFATVLSLSACAPQALYRETAYYLYTQVEITTYGQLNRAIYEEIWQQLNAIDNALSMNVSDSEVVRINKSAGIAPVAVSASTYQLIKKALSYSQRSDRFDITIGPLVDLWGIGSDDAVVPNAEDINAVLPLIDYRLVVLDDDTHSVFLPKAGMMIDLGAIAKGYAADLTKDILIKHGVSSAIINFGGNILTIGKKNDASAWKIGVQNPNASRGSYVGILELDDQSIVTSGIYERFLDVDGKRYHHILSPSDGYPVDNGVAGVSIIADQSIDCDALSTLIFAEGVTNGMAIIEQLDGVECIFITTDNAVYVSKGIANRFSLTDQSYRIVKE